MRSILSVGLVDVQEGLADLQFHEGRSPSNRICPWSLPHHFHSCPSLWVSSVEEPPADGLARSHDGRGQSNRNCIIYIYILITLPKTNIDPDNGPMEDYFPLPTRGFQVPC